MNQDWLRGGHINSIHVSDTYPGNWTATAYFNPFTPISPEAREKCLPTRIGRILAHGQGKRHEQNDLLLIPGGSTIVDQRHARIGKPVSVREVEARNGLFARVKTSELATKAVDSVGIEMGCKPNLYSRFNDRRPAVWLR